LVRNLLDNAQRHARTRIGLALAEDDGEVVLTIDDDGPGIPPERRDEVFERFARLDEARTPGDGRTGLGLAIARDIAERHGGSIVVTEAPIGGARFQARLPRS
jgi:signal transduction histidine kinase